jgi:transcriptional regulator with XRE-family HTH domain
MTRSTAGLPLAALRREYANNLQDRLIDKGWTQSELARRVAPLLKESRIGRDNISKYVRGRVLPLPPAQVAIAKVLECEPNDLLPSRATSAVSNGPPSLDVRDIGNGRVWLQINQAVEWPMALQIMGILKGGSGG